MNAILSSSPTIARALLGLVFLLFGLNGFLGVLPKPQVPEAASDFLGALLATGYVLPMVLAADASPAPLSDARPAMGPARPVR